MRPERKTLILDKDGHWVEELYLKAAPVNLRNLGEGSRFKEGQVVATLSWSSGTPRTRQGTQLQPMAYGELRAFGNMCLEMAKEMEDSERKGK